MTTTTRRSASIRTGLAAVAASAMIGFLPTVATAAPTTAPSATTAATQVPSDILAHIVDYENLIAANPNIVVGAKVGDIQCNADLTECWQVFEHGAIYANANAATRLTEPVYKAMLAVGGTDVLGYPSADQFCPPVLEGGCRQLFTQGEVDTLANGTEAYAVYGPFWTAWLKSTSRYTGNGPSGPWGMPTSNQTCDTNGVCTQTFTGGVAFYSAATGAALIPTRAYAVYTAGVTGENPMGLPTSEAQQNHYGFMGQSFQHGHLYPGPDGTIFKSYGPIYDLYVAMGDQGGTLGPVTGNPVCDLPHGGCYQTFWNGWIITSPTTGTYAVTGDIQKQFASPEDMAAKVGLPTGEAIQKGKMTVQTFEKSTVRVTPGTAKHA